MPLFPRSHRSFLPLFLPSRQRIHQLYRLTIKLRYFPIFFTVLRYLSNFFAVMRCSATPNVPLFTLKRNIVDIVDRGTQRNRSTKYPLCKLNLNWLANLGMRSSACWDGFPWRKFVGIVSIVPGKMNQNPFAG